MNIHFTGNQSYAFLHTGQTEARPPLGIAEIETLATVGDAEFNTVLRAKKRKLRSFRVSMPPDVIQGFLGDAKETKFDVMRNDFRQLTYGYNNWYGFAPGEVLTF